MPAALIMHLRLKPVMNARGKTKPHLRRYYAFRVDANVPVKVFIAND